MSEEESVLLEKLTAGYDQLSARVDALAVLACASFALTCQQQPHLMGEVEALLAREPSQADTANDEFNRFAAFCDELRALVEGAKSSTAPTE